MKKHLRLFILFFALLQHLSVAANVWPDGTPISEWFSDTARLDPAKLGRQYVVTDYGVCRYSTLLQT